MEIIKGNHTHASIVVDLVIELLKGFNEKSGSSFTLNRDAIIDTTYKLMDRSSFGCYIAFENAVPVGLITIAQGFAIYNGGDFGVITELYVDRQFRSRGIGKLLLEKAYEFAKQQNWKKIEVGAPSKTEWSRTIDFYKNNGFEEKGPKLRINIA